MKQFLITLLNKLLRIYTMKTLKTIIAATILAASTTASADWDMPFFGDNNNSNWNNNGSNGYNGNNGYAPAPQAAPAATEAK
jgi:hypothetical protein